MNWIVQHFPRMNDQGRRVGTDVYPNPGTIVTSHYGRKYMVMDNGSVRRIEPKKKG